MRPGATDSEAGQVVEFKPWEVAGYSILLVLSFYFFVATFRILVRKM
jgi:hypothetical protein